MYVLSLEHHEGDDGDNYEEGVITAVMVFLVLGSEKAGVDRMILQRSF